MRSLRYFFILILTMSWLGGCQAPPTKMYETQPSVPKNGIEIEPGTVIIDGRPAFEYSVAHLNGSIPMHWQDFAQREEPYLGLLDGDFFFHARRLARHGISPETPIVVVGRGLKGDGEEGRLAWTLRYYGISRVRFTSIDSFSRPLTIEEAPPIKPVPIWKPKLEASLVVGRKEFLRLAFKDRSTPESVVILDVRTEKEYLGQHPSYYSKKAPDLAAINVPWTQFLNSRGEANSEIKPKLSEVGITPDRNILVIDDKGVRSATVTLVLRDLGFAKVRNFAGGYMELLGRR